MRTFLFILILFVLGFWGTCTYVSSQDKVPNILSNVQLYQTRLIQINGVDFFVLDVNDIVTPDTVDYQFFFHAPSGMLWFVTYHDSTDWYLWDVADTTAKKFERRE